MSILKRLNDVHNNFYRYDNTIYTNMNNKIIITCPTHGDFEQRADHHVSGRTCKSCSTKITAKKYKYQLKNF